MFTALSAPSPYSPLSRGPRRMCQGWVGFLIAVAIVWAPRPTEAQPEQFSPERFSIDARPTKGLEIPAGPIVGRAGASALELNPGQLGVVDHLSLDFVANLMPDRAAWAGRGSGLFLAVPAGGLKLGGALQWLTPPGHGPTHTKSQIGLGIGGSGRFGLGVVWNHFFADDNTLLSSLDTFDIGMTLRPWRFVGVGVVARDIFQPGVPGATRLQRIYETEVAIRPLGIDRLEVAGGVRIGESRATTAYRLRLASEFYRGLWLLGQFDNVPVDVGGMTIDDRRVTLALSVDFSHAGLTFAGYGSRMANSTTIPGAPANNSAGMGVMLSLRQERSQPLLPDRRIERIDLRDVEDESDFLRLTVRLQRLATDPDVRGVLFNLDDLDGNAMGLALVEELRDLIGVLRAGGKKTYAFFTNVGTRGYYLAAACDQVFMQAAGTLTLNGMGVSTTFFKGALDKLGVSVDLIRVGRFKGAMEPFVRTGWSDSVGDNLRRIIDTTGDRVVAAVAEGRKALDPLRVKALMNQAIFTAAEAKSLGLIDDVQHLGDLDTINGTKVTKGDPSPYARRAWTLPRVAVVLVPGPIVDGESQRLPLQSGQTAGARTVVGNLGKAAADGSVRAVILRVNSPGGSVSASEDIARAIKKVRDAGKPVFVSMGDVAASGGYYVAAPGDRIFAQPSTMTGSIGIYTYHVDATALMSSLGLTTDSHETAPRALAQRPSQTWTDEDFTIMQGHIGQLYRLFLETVSDGRKPRHESMTPERVDELGQGQVLTGSEARHAHLVDDHGGFMAAVHAAVRESRVPTDDFGLPELIIYPNLTKPLFQVAVSPARLFGPVPEDAASLLAIFQRALGRAGRAAVQVLAPVLISPDAKAMALAPILWAPP